MENIIYPLLYYKIKEKVVLGILVGTEYQVMDTDLKGIKGTLSGYLQKYYKKNNYYPYMGLLAPKLKIAEVKIRPTYKEKTGSYPLTQSLKIPIVAIYGENKNNYYECHLPTLGESFYYYDARQFSSLLTHFARTKLNQKTPEELQAFLRHGTPQLDSITLRVNTHRKNKWGGNNYKRKSDTLTRLAEQYPYQKALTKNISAFPEAAWELEDKVSEIVDKLIQQRANLLIVGKSGSGKSSCLKTAIRKIASSVRKNQLEMTFWQIIPQRITATSKYLGEWQETVEDLISDLQATNGVLWVVDFIRLLQIGGQGPEDSVAAFLVNFLHQNQIQLIGEVTPAELESIRRLLPGFVENFQIVKIPELQEEKIFNILNKFADYSDSNLKIKIPHQSIELSYRLLHRYFPYESFPGKAVRFLGTCVSKAKIEEKKEIKPNHIIENFVEQTGLPRLFLRDDILLDQKELYDYFSGQIIGQEPAVNQLCNIVKIFKAGLNNPYKPISTLIFAGPTGVGKTASAKALAQYFFGKGQTQSPLIRIDMSEFQYPGMISRFIGQGRHPGKVVQEIRERPFSVLLLDEVEKAHPSIFDALMNVLDEGFIVDAFGRITNFRNTIIIMTTNLGASNRKSLGFGQSKTDKSAQYLSAISKHFRPEFVNRVDGIIPFNALGKKVIEKIAFKELEALNQREGFAKKKIQLQFTPELVAFISEAGFDERYGARPLQRAIDDEVISPLAHWMLDHPKLKNKKVELNYDNKLIINLL